MCAPARRLCTLVFALAVLASACGPTVDLSKGLQVELISTGWFDAGIVEGKNKLVPTVTFKVKNVSDQKLVALQMNAVFRRVSEKEEWGSGLLSVAGSEGLAPGATSGPLSIKSQLGYTGTESRAEMLQNREFVDARVSLFAKYAATQWTPVAEAPISRQLITQ